MAIIKLIPAGDLDLQGHAFVMVSGSDLTRQKLASRFRFFLAEWFLDLRQGVPYFRDVFKKNPSLDVIRSVFRQVLIKTPGVKAIRRFELVFDNSARTLSFDFTVIATDGEVITVTPSDELFIIKTAA